MKCTLFAVFMIGDSVAVFSAAAIAGRLHSGCEARHSLQLQSLSKLIFICVHEDRRIGQATGREKSCVRVMPLSMFAFHYAYEAVGLCVCVMSAKHSS